MRAGNGHGRPVLPRRLGPGNHEAEHRLVGQAVLAAAVVDAVNHVVPVQPLPRTAVADVVRQAAVEQRVDGEVLGAVLPRRGALSLQHPRAQRVNDVELGHSRHCRRLAHDAGDHDGLLGDQVVRLVAFRPGLLDVGLDLGVDGRHILGRHEVDQDEGSVALQGGDDVGGWCRRGEPCQRDGGDIRRVNGGRKGAHAGGSRLKAARGSDVWILEYAVFNVLCESSAPCCGDAGYRSSLSPPFRIQEHNAECILPCFFYPFSTPSP